ncbi:MAG: hypothetical protein ACLP1D_22450 [Xanthobacteraceae bacterium]
MRNLLLLYSSLTKIREGLIGEDSLTIRDRLAAGLNSGRQFRWVTEYRTAFRRAYHEAGGCQIQAFQVALAEIFVRHQDLTGDDVEPAARYVAAVAASEVIGSPPPGPRLELELATILGVSQDGGEKFEDDLGLPSV